MDRRTLLQGLGGGALMAAAPTAWAQGGQGRWLRLESNNFIYFSAADEAKAREEVAVLEGFHTLLARLMPRSHRSPMKLTIHATSSPLELSIANPGLHRDVAGIYQARIEQVRAVTTVKALLERRRNLPRNVRDIDSRAILLHEYAHHHMRANNQLAYPPWYVEGFAEFLSTADFHDGGVDIGKVAANRTYGLLGGNWLKIEEFLTSRPGQVDDAQQFYKQSWLAAHYLFATAERSKGFDRYVRALENGGGLVKSFQPAFGISPEQFDKELKAYAGGSIKFWTIKEGQADGSSTKVRRLTRSADDLLLPTSWLMATPSASDAKDAVGRVRDQAAKFPDDPYAQQCRAWAEVWYGDLSEGRKQVDALLARNDNSAELHHLSGLCDLRAGQKAQDSALIGRAKKAFARAHNIDDSLPQYLFRYVEASIAESGGLDAHAVDALVATYQLAPQIGDIALTTTSALIRFGRFEEAEIVIAPLTADVHGGDLQHHAKAMREQAMAQKSEGFMFFGGVTYVDA